MIRKLRVLSTAVLTAVLLLTGCARSETSDGSEALTWSTWSNYNNHKPFIEHLKETHPEVEIDFISYMGGNATGYSWAQMRADDITDVFITSQILDAELARERLIDLSGYDFIGELPTSLLDHISIDGGVYLLPSTNLMFGIVYNKTLMEEHGWEVPQNFAELESLCAEIRAAGLIPGIVNTQLTASPFSAVFNLAKTSWLTTTEGAKWEQDFLAGNATAAGMWESTMEYVQKYIDIGMFTTDPEDRAAETLVREYLGNRKAVFLTMSSIVSSSVLENGDELGLMPYIGEDGSKNIYMYSPDKYFGISSRLTEPGNEKKLENAITLLSTLYSAEGQNTLLEGKSPCVMSVLGAADVSEDSMVYDAQQAMHDGRAFPMTYANWDGVLADMGQAFKDWMRGENGMDGEKCIACMDELQSAYLSNDEEIYFCESTADFTTEQTAALVGKALGSAVGADAAMIPVGEFHDGVELPAGVSGKLYKGLINAEVSTTIVPAYDGEYAIMTMTGAEAKSLAAAGFAASEEVAPFPYILTAKGGVLDDDTTYKVAFPKHGYTQQTAETYNAVVESGSLRTFLREWLEKEKTVSPDGNPWE
ncbi:MAG: ABC transporter substrate-binding protein [bacterium]|nr:ABC transporter substrate-binding protein [bacterium]